MAAVQSYFMDFHDAIKMEDENETLREKREILIEKLKDGLKEHIALPPSFTWFNKGGYAMHLGVKPLDGDYDLDVGLEFDINKADYPDPVVVKKWVFNALLGHTDDVKIKKPCVTVQYHLNKEPVYHVDFAVYGKDGLTDCLYLARGKPTSPDEERVWQLDDPKCLIVTIRDRFQDEDDRCQFRRVIRYLKRWKDIKFSLEGHGAPIGIGLTTAAFHWLTISKQLADPIKMTYQYDDLNAALRLVERMLSEFQAVSVHEDQILYRLRVQLPVEPYADLFEKMTDVQMTSFKEKLEGLRDSLISARDEVDPVDACTTLRGQFGDDFPVPAIPATAQRRGPAIISSSSSA